MNLKKLIYKHKKKDISYFTSLLNEINIKVKD